ncbi:MAG: TlpA disulfide reductase family protein [Gemmatimonadetes bacterium]|nr:TlpA disulfide reductase family protein [Gemmatimonadota bacterium]
MKNCIKNRLNTQALNSPPKRGNSTPVNAEMRDIQKLQRALGDSILIVGIDDEPADTVREFVQNRGYTWTFILDPDNEVARTYNVSVIPTSVFIDAKGVIVRKFVGQKDYKTFLEAAREAINN